MTITIVSPAAAPAVSLEDARTFARIDGTANDSEIQTMVAAISSEAEHKTGRVLILRTYRIMLDAFPAAVDAPASPVASVAAINYVAADGVERTLNSSLYRLVGTQVIPVGEWPVTGGSVIVDFVCGYGASSADIPAGYRAYIGAKLAEHFAQPGSPKSQYLDNLIQPYKVY